MINEIPFKKNLPTAPAFIVRDDKNFDEGKRRLIDLVQRFSKEREQALDTRVHPFLGRLTSDEWNTLHWKHLDHHRRQFGG